MKLRYEVRDEYNEIVRCFASKQEALAHCKLDPSFWIKTNKIAKPTPFRTAWERLGECLF
jgi:hypothetical protein